MRAKRGRFAGSLSTSRDGPCVSLVGEPGSEHDVDTIINGHNAATTTPADMKIQSEFIGEFVRQVSPLLGVDGRSMETKRSDWMARVVADPGQRDREFRKAANTETVFSLIAVALAAVTVWGFTAGTSLGGIRSESIGGIAVLSFSACMAVAAGGGIKKRFITLMTELDGQRS